MPNRWGIPKETEKVVIDRDTNCVYCGVVFKDSDTNRKTRKTWEHIINDVSITGSDNIALCCGSCNASKGSKKLQEWLKSKYCQTKKITKDTVSPVVKKHLNLNYNLEDE